MIATAPEPLRQSAAHERERVLCELALAALASMQDPLTGLFRFTCRSDDSGRTVTGRGASVRYTAIACLGLEQALQKAHHSLWDIEAAQARALAACESRLALGAVRNLGDVALLAWAGLRARPSLAQAALGRLADWGPLTADPEHARFHATELAWVVAAVALATRQGLAVAPGLLIRAIATLRGGMDPRTGLLSVRWPASPRASGLEGLRSHLGFFDGQAYGAFALATYAELTGDARALEQAVRLGAWICRHQSPLGGFGWHYNVRTGALVDAYPLYAVHQDGMGPMALRAVWRVGGTDPSAAIERGLAWLFGENELGRSLVDREGGTIWRSIRRTGSLARSLLFARKALSFAHLSAPHALAKPGDLGIDWESRPYHLGWLLYALTVSA